MNVPIPSNNNIVIAITQGTALVALDASARDELIGRGWIITN